jgi:DNA-binding transcriptional regulator YiaG
LGGQDGRNVGVPAWWSKLGLRRRSTLSVTNPDFTPERIKVLRARLGLTQAEFGVRLGISQKAVSAWEIHGIPKRYTAVFKLLELERTAKSR